MSFEAMAWAVRQKTGGSTAKLILLMLANHANGYSGQCNPSHKRMAEECEISESCLKANLKRLKEAGLTSIKTNRTRDGKSLTNDYVLNMSGGQNLAGEGADLPPGRGQNLAGEGAESGYKPVSEPISEPVNKNNTRQARNGLYETEFQEVWNAYPKRPGSSKAAALKAFSARRNAGHSLETILSGVRAYSAYCSSKVADSSYIKHLSTFLGAGEFFLADWSVKENPSSGGKGLFESLDAIVAAEKKGA